MSWGTQILDMRALHHPDHILVENSAMANLLTELGIENTLLYPGIDVTSPAMLARPGRGGPILAVGRLADDRKDWPLLIRAYARLRSVAGASAPGLILAGRGGLDPTALQLIDDLALSEHVQILSDVPLDQLQQLYGDACMLVLTSKEEGLGLVVLEAMAASLPVVASDLVGTRESIVHGKTGFLVNREEDQPDEAFAQKMRLLLESAELREKLGRNGRIRAEKVFSREVTQAKLLTLYERMLTR